MEAKPFTNTNAIDRAWYNDLERNRNYVIYIFRTSADRTHDRKVEVGRTVAMETAGKVLGGSS